MSTGWLNLATVPRQAFRPPLGGPSHPVPDQSEEIQAARLRESVAVRALQKKQKLSQGNPTEMVKTEPTVTAFISATSNVSTTNRESSTSDTSSRIADN